MRTIFPLTCSMISSGNIALKHYRYTKNPLNVSIMFDLIITPLFTFKRFVFTYIMMSKTFSLILMLSNWLTICLSIPINESNSLSINFHNNLFIYVYGNIYESCHIKRVNTYMRVVEISIIIITFITIYSHKINILLF